MEINKFNEMKKTKFQNMTLKLSQVSSFAYWSENKNNIYNCDGGDLSWTKDNKIISTLKTNYFFLGFNPADHNKEKNYVNGEPDHYGAFHSKDTIRAKDKKLCFALRGTKYFGSYITDVFKEHVETKPKNLKLYDNDKLVAAKILIDEIKFLGNVKEIILLGNDVKKVFRWMTNKKNISIYNELKEFKSVIDQIKITYTLHYSSYTNLNQYKDRIHKDLKI